MSNYYDDFEQYEDYLFADREAKGLCGICAEVKTNNHICKKPE